MTDDERTSDRRPVVLGPGEGRAYPMGRISAVFKADGDETARSYAISEWWLDAYTTGPGAHSHAEDDLFYVPSGTMSILVDTEWIDAAAGSAAQRSGTVVDTQDTHGPGIVVDLIDHAGCRRAATTPYLALQRMPHRTKHGSAPEDMTSSSSEERRVVEPLPATSIQTVAAVR